MCFVGSEAARDLQRDDQRSCSSVKEEQKISDPSQEIQLDTKQNKKDHFQLV